MATEIIETLDCGDDVLLVRGHVDGVTVTGPDPENPDQETDLPAVVEARGWLSAMTNHYGDDAYDNDGNLRRGAKPRAMTKAEKIAYCESLLAGAVPAAAVEPTPIQL